MAYIKIKRTKFKLNMGTILNIILSFFKILWGKIKGYRIYSVLAVIIVIMCVVTCSMNNHIRTLKNEQSKYKNNEIALLEQTKEYKTKDSLNAASVYELQMSLVAYKKYHADDMDKIKNLELKNRKLENIITVNGKVKIPIDIPVKDSIVYVDKVIRDTVKTIKCSNEWYNIDGIVDKSFKGTIGFKEKLGITISVRYKRFLGFLWYTSKVKDKKCDVVNFNPYGEVTKIEYVTIK